MLRSAWIIVLNWNGIQHLPTCLGSLTSIDYPNCNILLVDNGSTDQSLQFVRKNFPDIRIIANRQNLGFAEGNNIGIRHALSNGADYIVLLNNDTRVEPDFLTRLITRGEAKPDIGVLGGKVLMMDNPDIVNSTGINMNLFAYGWDRDFGEKASEVNRPGGEVLAVTGCLMAIKKQVFEKIGLLDPDFFAYMEDLDFCLRVWKCTDFKIEYMPEAIIYHKFSASTPGKFKRRLMAINQYRIFFRHFPLPVIIKIFPLMTLHRIAILAAHLLRLDFRMFISECYLIIKHWIMLPIYLCRSIFKSEKRIDPDLFRKYAVQEKGRPSFKKPGRVRDSFF